MGAPVSFKFINIFKVQHFLGRFCRARGLIFLLSEQGNQYVDIKMKEKRTLSFN